MRALGKNGILSWRKADKIARCVAGHRRRWGMASSLRVNDDGHNAIVYDPANGASTIWDISALRVRKVKERAPYK